MNKVITDGIDLMPTAFNLGLDQWSDQDGTPGSTTYDGATNAALVPSDSDFGSCLELLKNDATQKLRYMGETPLSPGCYLKITARVKAMSGNLPSVRIAAWAGDGSSSHVTGLVEEGKDVALTAYGEVVEVYAIIGSGNRTGVDMVWGTQPTLAHFGIDLTGSTGGVVRVDDIVIEDATDVFHRKMMDWVDVRDYGAIGDGITDDQAAIEAADVAAAGQKTVLVSDGVYKIASNLAIESVIRFEGTLTMDDTVRLSLTKNYDLPSYIDAFGDEELALKKALQALFNYTDQESLDMCGRRVSLTEPLDVHAAVDNVDTFANRRVLRNGQVQAAAGSAWDMVTVTSSATYDSNDKTTLSNVTNISTVPVGALVTGTGVGREVYVRSVDIPAGTLELSQPLFGAPVSQTYTFDRFQYLLDFSGFSNLKRFGISGVEFLCQGNCSALMLTDDGLSLQIQECYFTTPKDRGITSIGHTCSGLQIDRCQFISYEQSWDVLDRTSIAFNVNANDAKIRDNRSVKLKHFGVIGGTGHLILGNHFFQGDNAVTGYRTAGIVLTNNNCKTTVTGNYIDNSFIEWTNEHDESPDNVSGFSFGALTIEGNIFTSNGSASWFRFIQIKPHGIDHYINGLNISGNTFKHINSSDIERAEGIDSSIATLDFSRFRNISVFGNTYNGITDRMFNPVMLEADETSESATWTVDFSRHLPFGGWARNVTAVVPEGEITNGSDNGVFTQPYAVVQQGADNSEIKLKWSEAVKGRVQVTARVDNMT